ncbi:hypothetical protein EVG20_g3088 [Dentipellis fragilis]|uniref:Uncharacterized protein n=1 Tax=Dentipellis fragilis TaxID=205917 RepID=A0A4Y9Z643_9AGAM|nr:hypothetical protein EVG20_g3088 [Dentipellis fragilis]
MPNLSLIWLPYVLGLLYPGSLPPWPSIFIFILIGLQLYLDNYTLNIVTALTYIIVIASVFKYDLTMRIIGTPLRVAIFIYDAPRRIRVMASTLFSSCYTSPPPSPSAETKDTLPGDEPEFVDPDETLVDDTEDTEATPKSPSPSKPKAAPRRNVFRAPDGDSTDGDTDSEDEAPRQRSHASRPPTPIFTPTPNLRRPGCRGHGHVSPVSLSTLALPSSFANKVPEKKQRPPVARSQKSSSKKPTSGLFGNAPRPKSSQRSQRSPSSVGQVNTGLSSTSHQTVQKQTAEKRTADQPTVEQPTTGKQNAVQPTAVQVTIGQQVVEQQVTESTPPIQSHVEQPSSNQSPPGPHHKASTFADSRTTFCGYESEQERHVRRESSETSDSVPAVNEPSTNPLVASKSDVDSPPMDDISQPSPVALVASRPASPPVDGVSHALELAPFLDALSKSGGLPGIFEVPEGFSPLNPLRELLDTPPPTINLLSGAGASSSQPSAQGKAMAVGSAERHLIDLDGSSVHGGDAEVPDGQDTERPHTDLASMLAEYGLPEQDVPGPVVALAGPVVAAPGPIIAVSGPVIAASGPVIAAPPSAIHPALATPAIGQSSIPPAFTTPNEELSDYDTPMTDAPGAVLQAVRNSARRTASWKRMWRLVDDDGEDLLMADVVPEPASPGAFDADVMEVDDVQLSGLGAQVADFKKQDDAMHWFRPREPVDMDIEL